MHLTISIPPWHVFDLRLLARALGSTMLQPECLMKLGARVSFMMRTAAVSFPAMVHPESDLTGPPSQA